jgi:hypothetical protein
MSLEKDTTAIKELVEAGLFKPATPEQIANRQPPRQPGEDICPHCKADLRDDRIWAVIKLDDQETSTQVGYGNGEWGYGEVEYGGSNSIGFVCGKCKKPLNHGVDFDRENTL